MQFLLCMYIVSLSIFSVITTTSSSLTANFNITIRAPYTISSPLPIPYKSVHVQYTVPNDKDQWNIISIEPLILKANRTIRQLSVHICQFTNKVFLQKSIWYDDQTICRGGSSMLIYHWAALSIGTSFRGLNDLGIQIDKSKSIVLTVTYVHEQYVHKEQPGVVLHISTLIPRFHLASLTVGNKYRATRFSCRVLNYPRLLYSIKPLFPKTKRTWWRIYVIRNRSFGRKLVQFVLDSTMFLNKNRTEMEILSSDIFLISGDYIIVECDDHDQDSNCNFLIFYVYKNVNYKSSIENVHSCKHNSYPDLFKLIPTKASLSTTTVPPMLSSVDSSTVFLLICLLLVIIWISIIVGCVIMRRIRGLVNFRTEPFGLIGAQPTKAMYDRRANDAGQQKLAAEADHIAQLDIEHMGLMS